MSTPAVQLKGIHRTFSSRYILRNLDAEIASGESVVILGENGAGKTTLLRIMATLLTPTSGTLRLWDELVDDRKTEIRPRIGLAFSESHFYSDLTVQENLNLIVRLRHIPEGSQKIEALLDRWRLTSLRNSVVRTLSKGERQRLSLLRSLLHNPDLLIWDEPTNGLDEKARGVLNEVVSEIKGKTTLICTTHEPQHVQTWIDRTLRLQGGKLS